MVWPVSGVEIHLGRPVWAQSRFRPGANLTYSYRGKGGKEGRRELPRPAADALRAAHAAFARDLGVMAPGESLWPTQAAVNGCGLTSGTFYGRFRRYLTKAGLPPAGLHVLRHTAGKLRRDAGESIEDVSRFLDHSSLAVTTTYLRRLDDWDSRYGYAHPSTFLNLIGRAASHQGARKSPPRLPRPGSRQHGGEGVLRRRYPAHLNFRSLHSWERTQTGHSGRPDCA
jgi:Phage integrase family